MQTDTLLTTGEAARMLAVDPDTVRVWERSGKLPAARTPSGRRLFSLEDIQRVAAERAAPAREKETLT